MADSLIVAYEEIGAERANSIEQSPLYFETMVAAGLGEELSPAMRYDPDVAALGRHI